MGGALTLYEACEYVILTNKIIKNYNLQSLYKLILKIISLTDC